MAKTNARGGLKLPAIDGRTAAIGAAALAVGAGLGAALFGEWRREPEAREPLIEPADSKATGNRDRLGADPLPASELSADIDSTARAPDEFRPDRDAAVADGKRDAFAPATIPAPTRIEAMGDGTL